MQNPAKSLAILLLVIVAVALALAACNNSSDDGRITALEEGLSRAEAQERKSREAYRRRARGNRRTAVRLGAGLGAG